MLPIPGTSSVAHLESNVGAAAVRLIDADLEAIDSAVGSSLVNRGMRSVRKLLNRRR
jgi:aryl-alcohol dehydrogenase-like predicted oxidoreductase